MRYTATLVIRQRSEPHKMENIKNIFKQATTQSSHTLNSLIFYCPTTRHEGAWGERGIATTHSRPWH
jgi:hypothetical protein